MANPHERVYAILDVVTKPLQWCIGGIKVLGFMSLVAVVAVVAPVYHLVTTGAASATEVEIALFVVGVVILFIAEPWYPVLAGVVLLGSVFCYAVFNPDPPAPSHEVVRYVLWSFLLVGYLWVGVKRSRRNRVYGDSCRQEKCTNSGRVHSSRTRRHAAPKRDRNEVAKSDKTADRYYRVLGVQSGATKEEIKQAYRDLVKIWHPDRFSADDERFRRKAEAKLKEINEAYAYINSHTGADSPASDAHFVDVNDATQYITAITRNVNGEVQDLVRRFKAGEFAERADALEAFGRMVARMEAVSANVNDVVERVKRDVPNAAANATFIQSQQNMNQVAEAIRQMKELLECQ